VNLKEEARKLQAQIAGGEEHEPGVQSAFQHFAVRAYYYCVKKYVTRHHPLSGERPHERQGSRCSSARARSS